MNPDNLMALINDYYNNPSSYTDQEAEVIARLTKQLGMPFDRERKPLRKLLYNAGEMATFGLLPDSFKPHSRGQNVYGETAIDSIASGAGNLLGLVGLGAGAVRGARGIINRFKKSPPPFFSDQLRLPGSVQYGRYGTPPRRNLLQLTEGQRSLPGQTRGQIRRNRLPLDSTSGQPIAMGGLRRPAPTDAGRTYREMRDLYGMDPNRLTDIELAMRRAERFRLEDSIQNMMDLDAVRFG